MKKLTTLIVWGSLCLIHSLAAPAQTTEVASRIAVGDTVPDRLLTGLRNSPHTTARLSDFRGQLLLIDFWATWCAPCIQMIPQTLALQKQFAGRLQILPVTAQAEKEVRTFQANYEKQQQLNLNYPEITGDKVLHQLFPHRTIPHYVWIGPDGRLLAVTEHGEVTAAGIEKMLNRSGTLVQKKPEASVPYDYHQPLLIGGNGGDGRNLLYHSVLTGYTPGLGSGMVVRVDPAWGKQITARNLSVIRLFEIAYSDSGRTFNHLNTRLAVKDTTRVTNPKATGQRYREWQAAGNGFCYELQVPKHLIASANTMMQGDLDRLFPQYRGYTEKEERECLVLSGSSSGKGDPVPPASKGGKPEVTIDPFHWGVVNSSPGVLVFRLNYFGTLGLPVRDETGITTPIDLEVTLTGKKPDLAAINRELARYHLQFSRERRTFERLVIADR